MNTNQFPTLLLAAAAALAAGPTVFAADSSAPVEQARSAVHSTEHGAGTAVQPVQYVSTPWGYTWYGANSYAYAPASYYVAPVYDYYGFDPYYGYSSYYGPAWRTSYYAPSVSTYTTYRPYYGMAGYGWLPYSYQSQPYGSFYRYYGPVYGSGFHMWFGY